MIIYKKDLNSPKIPSLEGLWKRWITGNWIKTLKSLHDQLLNFLNLRLPSRKIPDWMVCGKTILIHEGLSKGTIPSSYRPITYLPSIWEILTGIISDKMYETLDERRVLTEEQNGCNKGARGTNDLVFIDKIVLKQAKRREKKSSYVLDRLS